MNEHIQGIIRILAEIAVEQYLAELQEAKNAEDVKQTTSEEGNDHE